MIFFISLIMRRGLLPFHQKVFYRHHNISHRTSTINIGLPLVQQERKKNHFVFIESFNFSGVSPRLPSSDPPGPSTCLTLWHSVPRASIPRRRTPNLSTVRVGHSRAGPALAIRRTTTGGWSHYGYGRKRCWHGEWPICRIWTFWICGRRDPRQVLVLRTKLGSRTVLGQASLNRCSRQHWLQVGKTEEEKNVIIDLPLARA